MQSFKPYTLNLRGRLLSIDRPQVMGIINVTPDSFFSDSRVANRDSVIKRAKQMIQDGADMIDIGGYSSRPGACDVSPDEETERVLLGIEAIRSINNEIPISIDTFRASVAESAINSGADIINDISGGNLDSDMFATVAKLNVPYILMHMRGNPTNMQTLTDYKNLTADIIYDLASKINALRLAGVSDTIVDPGFGFSKTLDQNYELLANLPSIADALNCPLLIGISRKSMITKPLAISPAEALNGTTAINTIALLNGASILRVHDVKEARQTIDLCLLYNKYKL